MRMRKDNSTKRRSTDTQHMNMIFAEKSNDTLLQQKPLRCFSLALSKSPDNNTSFIDERGRTIWCMPSLTCARLVATWGFKEPSSCIVSNHPKTHFFVFAWHGLFPNRHHVLHFSSTETGEVAASCVSLLVLNVVVMGRQRGASNQAAIAATFRPQPKLTFVLKQCRTTGMVERGCVKRIYRIYILNI